MEREKKEKKMTSDDRLTAVVKGCLHYIRSLHPTLIFSTAINNVPNFPIMFSRMQENDFILDFQIVYIYTW